MDIKAVCSVIFIDERRARSDISSGTMHISVALESWQTAKDPILQRYIISKTVRVLDDLQLSLHSMGTESKQKVVYEDTTAFLCPDDMSPADVIRLALDMLDSKEAADAVFLQLNAEGKLIKPYIPTVEQPA